MIFSTKITYSFFFSILPFRGEGTNEKKKEKKKTKKPVTHKHNKNYWFKIHAKYMSKNSSYSNRFTAYSTMYSVLHVANRNMRENIVDLFLIGA